MASIWIILYPYSSSRRIRKLAALGIIGLLFLYIFIFLKTSADIENYRQQLAKWNSKIIRSLTFANPEEPPDWQTVGLANSSFAVYSAFSSDNASNEVIIVGSHPDFQDDTLRCRFYYDDTDSLVTVAYYELIPGWNPRFADSIIRCYLPTTNDQSTRTHENTIATTAESKPRFVSILAGNNTTEYENRLQVHYNLPVGHLSNDEYLYNFSVCVSPMNNNNYKNLLYFLEWLEYYKLMGVQHFSFYNLSLGSNNSCVLEHLIGDPLKNGEARINNYPWQKYPKNPTIHSSGISSAMTDCHLRNKGVSKYVVIVDLNEFITPVLDSMISFQDLIDFLDTEKNAEVEFGVYTFHEGYFTISGRRASDGVQESCALLKNKPIEYRVCQNMLLMKFSQRNVLERKVSENTKYIMIPERVKVVGKYGANLMEARFKTKRVSEKIAYIRQYGGISFMGRRNQTVDNVDLKLGLVLAKNVASRVEYFMEKCGMEENDIFFTI